MNFKIKPFALFLAGAALAITGCKDDVMSDMENGGGKADGHYLHVKAGIALPISTRSATDDPANSGDDLTNSDENVNGNEDFEYGSAYENEIRTMILVYTDTLNQYITHSVVDGITKAPVTGQKYEYEVIGEIEHEKLQAAYEDGVLSELANEDGEEIPVRVWAICNFTERLAGNFAGAGPTTLATWMDWIGTVEEGPSVAGKQPLIDNTIWAQRSFLMANAAIANVTFPGSIEEWDEYTDKSTPWELKDKSDDTIDPQQQPLYAIKVERAAARFDIRDGSENKDQVYHLYTHENSYGDDVDNDGNQAGEGELNLIDIKLTRMALVNMSKNFYYLRRVSPTGTNDKWVYCGRETATGGATPFVVDTDWSDKNTRSIKASNNNFNFPLYTEDSLYNKNEWYVDKYSQILNNKKVDNWSGSADNRYHIWRYVTENTIPGKENQITVQSTGVVFKGRILLGDDYEEGGADHYISQDLIDALSNTTATSAILYRFENRLFAGPNDIIAGAAQDGTNSTLYGAVKNILSNWKLDTDGQTYKIGGAGEALTPARANDIIFNKADPNVDPAVTTMKIDGLTDENFSKYNTPKTSKISMFRPELLDEGDGGTDEKYGYYCYYFYWNRHNDNNKSGLMGEMEFATVRNNVYKLAVTGIGKIGHPTTPGDDDDPEEPNDPDEDPTNYIQVNVEVLPWVVRVNNIEF